MFKKDLKFDIKSVTETGTFEGLLSVYDVVDLGNDLVTKGAFTKTIADHKGTVPMLWQHNPEAPIGTLELTDTEQGLHVKGTFLLEVKQAQEAYALVKAGVIRGLSIGYDAIKKQVKDGVRHLTEIKLWEGSVVTFPMLPVAQITSVKAQTKDDFATVLEEQQTFMMRSMMKDALCCSLDSIVWDSNLTDEEKIAASSDSIQQFAESYITFLPKLFAAWESYKSHGDPKQFIAEIKAGRRNSAADEAMLRGMLDNILALLGEEAANAIFAAVMQAEPGKGTSPGAAAGTSPEAAAQPSFEDEKTVDLDSKLTETQAAIRAAITGAINQWN